MPLKQSEKQGTILVEKPVSPQPITSIQQIVEDASSWPVVDGVKQKDGFAYCDGSTLVNTSGTYDDFNTANGSLVLPNGPFRTNEIDLTFISTPTGWSLISARGFAYTDVKGNWRLQFNIQATKTASVSAAATISGVTFVGTEACSMTSGSNTEMRAFVNGGAVNVRTTASDTNFYTSGDVQLASKPSWADANLDSYPVISLQSNIANAIGIPEASASQAGVVSTGTQTFAGAKTFDEITATTYNGLPVASTLSSGVVNTGAQTFAGAKTFNTGIDVTGAVTADGLTADNGVTEVSLTTNDWRINSAQNAPQLYVDALTNTSSGNVLSRYNLNSGSGNGSAFIWFGRGASIIGSITQASTTSVAFNTTSDQRLKENFEDFAGLDLVDGMNVYKYQWKTQENQDTTFSYGVKAQEFYSVFPQAVHVGDNDEQVSVPWGIDHSKIEPVLIKAIQELKAEIDILKGNN